MKALSEAIGDKAVASGSGSTGTTVIAGKNENLDEQKYFSTLELSSGAYGARANSDGINAIRYGPGNAGHVPIEADELENPIFFEAYEIVQDTGGAGKYRGGNGFIRKFRVDSKFAKICICSDRHNTGPPGIFGGLPGSKAVYKLEFFDKQKTEMFLSSKTPYIHLEYKTSVILQSAGGGGFGDPKKREKERIVYDLRNGYISKEKAKKVYGFEEFNEK